MQTAAMEKLVWILKRNTPIACIYVVPICIHTRPTNQCHTTMYKCRVPRDLPTCICVCGISVILNTYICACCMLTVFNMVAFDVDCESDLI